jgi:hypothetical protein
VESEGSLPYSQEFFTSPYHEADEYSSISPNPIYLRLILILSSLIRPVGLFASANGELSCINTSLTVRACTAESEENHVFVLAQKYF